MNLRMIAGSARMIAGSAALVASLTLGFVLFSASTATADSNFVCPTSAADGTNITVTATLENNTCSATTVRLIASIVGNADGTLGGVGIYGPEVILPLVSVPIGSNPSCGCGGGGTCSCSPGVSCTTDGECPFCFMQTPGSTTAAVSVSPALPAALDGTVATVVFIEEIEEASGEVSSETAECFVDVL